MAQATDELEQAPQVAIEPTTDRNAIIDTLELTERTLAKADLATGIFKAHSGVVIQFSRPNPNLIQKAMERFEAPSVPEVYDKEFEAMKPNPDDPDYVKAVEKYTSESLALVTDIYVSHVEIRECPSNLSPVHETDWEEDVSMFGVEVPARGRARILAWLNYYAINDEDEFAELVDFAFMYNNRMREEDVRARIDSFRNPPEQSADPVGAAESS